MAIRMEEIYNSLKDKYQLVQKAGDNSVSEYIECVHIVENVSIIPYLRNNELIITTGIAMDIDKELLDFCKGIRERGVSGLIINVGPYIPRIPKEVTEYSRSVDFPLFSLPWEIQLTDLGRDLYKILLKSEYLEYSECYLSGLFKDAIYYPEQIDKTIQSLAREGFSQDTKYHLLLLNSEQKNRKNNTLQEEYQKLKHFIERISDRSILFVNNNIIVIVLADFTDRSFKQVVERISYFCKQSKKKMYLAVGPGNIEIRQMATYYKRLKDILAFSIKREQKVIYYEDLDIHKLLLAVDDKNVMRELYEIRLGKLIEYDRTNKTNYMVLLKEYFNCGFNKVNLASKQFLHRNTIQYQLTKIEEIVGCDLKNNKDQFMIQLCFYMEDVL